MIITEDNAAFCINNLSGQEYDIPLLEMNKYTCYSDDDYGLLLTYIRLLRGSVPKRVSRKLKQFDTLHYKHIERADGLTAK